MWNPNAPIPQWLFIAIGTSPVWIGIILATLDSSGFFEIFKKENKS